MELVFIKSAKARYLFIVAAEEVDGVPQYGLALAGFAPSGSGLALERPRSQQPPAAEWALSLSPFQLEEIDNQPAAAAAAAVVVVVVVVLAPAVVVVALRSTAAGWDQSRASAATAALE